MFVPKNQFGEIEEITTNALEEGNFIMGYKKFIVAAQLDPDLEAEGMEILRLATNPTKALYRFREEIKELQAKKSAEARRQYKAALAGEDAEDPAKLAEFDKQIRKVEHKIVAAAYDLTLLREPLDNFLFESDIPVRDKYNKGRNQSDD